MKGLKAGSVLLLWVVLSSFSFVPYEWKDQKIHFSLPDFFIEENSNDFEFKANGNEMAFQLNVYMDELIEEGELDSFVSRVANEKFGLNQQDGESAISGNGFKGYYIVGLVEGNLVYVLGLLDNESGISYYGMIKYDDAENANRIFAKNIIDSFEKYN